jgi:hypothetical protein
MSWYRRSQPPKPPAPSPEPAPRAARRDRRWNGLLGALRANVGRRVTLFWRCGPAVGSTTGWIVKADGDVVEVRGAVRTFSEALGRAIRRSGGVVELNTVIPVRQVCALVEDVPRGVHVGIPLYVPARSAERRVAPPHPQRRGLVMEFPTPAARRAAAGA